MSSKDPSRSVHERKSVHKGEVIVRQGEVGLRAYLIQSGSVRVYSEVNGKTIELARLGAGQIFGEMALIKNVQRAASVIALEETTLVAITKEILSKKLSHSDPTIRALVPMLLDRLKNANDILSGKNMSLDDVVSAAQNSFDLYKNQLEPGPRRTFETSVGPRLDAFLSAMRAFGDKYEE